MTEHSKLVELSSGEKALAQPQFLLEHDGKLYLTVAVREFDPKHAGIRPNQARAIRQLTDILRSSPAVSKAARYNPPRAPAPPRPPKPGRPMPTISAGGEVGDGITFAATDPPD